MYQLVTLFCILVLCTFRAFGEGQSKIKEGLPPLLNKKGFSFPAGTTIVSFQSYFKLMVDFKFKLNIKRINHEIYEGLPSKVKVKKNRMCKERDSVI